MRRTSVIVPLLLVCTVVAWPWELNVAEVCGDENCVSEGTVIFLQVTREPDLTPADIQRIIEEFDCFQQMPDRHGVNPFTNEPMVFPGKGRAVYVERGEPVGNVALEEGRILFTGVPETVVRKVAELLSASVLPWDGS